MKLKIILPYGKETSIFKECLYGIESIKKKFDVICQMENYKNIDPARTLNKEIKKDVNNVDYFLLVDSDIGFDVSHVEKLLKRDKDIISAAYGKNLADMNNKNQNVFVSGLWGENVGILKYWICNKEKGLKKVDWCGTGFLLVKSTVFKKLEHPYFSYPIINISENWKDYASYDIGFFIKTNEKFEAWCDCDCEVKHLCV